MIKKFTEEQYQKIVEIADEYQSNSAFGIIGDTIQKSIGEEFYETELVNEIDFYENSKEMMAIANPLTREWAHDKFVEKEKKYYWTSKGEDSKGLKRRLYIKADRVRDYFEDEFLYNENEALTEQQVYQWGYNPEMFDKEEVQ